MENPDYVGTEYRLRAGSIMPTMHTGAFVVHTFKAEINDVHIYLYTKELLGSEDFRGQGGPYITANFSRLPDRNGNSFQGKAVKNSTYEDERAWGTGGSL